MHYHHIEDDKGDLIDLVPFCGDSCHRQWCDDNHVAYGGWNGAHEGADYPEFCACCGVIASVGLENEDACDCQRDNVVAGRFLSAEGEKCEHGNWIQLPAEMVNAKI